MYPGSLCSWAPWPCTLAVFRYSQQGGSTGITSPEHSPAHTSSPGDPQASPSRDGVPRRLSWTWLQLPLPQEPMCTFLLCNEECSNHPVQIGLGRTAPLSSHSQVPTEKRIQDLLGQKAQGTPFQPHRCGTGRQQPWV